MNYDRRRYHRGEGERRKHERYAAEILIEVETSGRRTYRRTANISLGGVGFHAPIPFRLDSEVFMTLRLAGNDAQVRVGGKVVGTDDSGRGTRVRFGELLRKDRKALEQHLRLFDAPTEIGPASRLALARASSSEKVLEGILIQRKATSDLEFRLRSTDKVIGRDPSMVDFVIEHTTVSRRHAHVYMQNGRHVITDLSSTNGIKFRGKPVHTLVLKDGMVFRIGKVEVQYLVTKRAQNK